jgi:polysaccharide pyruvyl transferase WcaK-like protein
MVGRFTGESVRAPVEMDGGQADMESQEGVGGGSAGATRGPPRVLLVGYNGANNTGSEARLLSIIEDIRAILGPDAQITIPTLNEANLCRYIQEGPKLSIAPVPSIYFFSLRRLVLQHDLVVLVEGSCYMDTWTSALLWAFLWATRVAAAAGKPCLAYAVDSGRLSPSNLKRVRREASKTDLIITRTESAAHRLREYGVTAPMEVTADAAFTFEMDPRDEDRLSREWPEADQGVVGFALVDFYSWPVVIRPWGRKENEYRWPYYFSRSRERREATERLAEGFATLADRLVEEHDRHVALFCMEELDKPLSEMVRDRVAHPERLRIFSACDYNASEMYGMLRGIELLISSRYHSCVMSMSKDIPMLAVGHDLRVEDLLRDMGVYETNFLNHSDPHLFETLADRVEAILADPGPEREAMGRAFASHMERARRNRSVARQFIANKGWSVVP